MRTITWLDKDYLIFVCIIQWAGLVSLDGEVEHRHARVYLLIQSSGAAALLRYELCPAETILWRGSSRCENRRPVNRRRYSLLC